MMYRIQLWLDIRAGRRESNRAVREYLYSKYTPWEVLSGKWRHLPAYPNLLPRNPYQYSHVCLIDNKRR